jgi:hypothetical protein
MATYKGIKGVKVVTKTSDPTASEADGTVWYNSTGDALKYAIAGAGTWASGGALNTPKYGLVGAGTNAAAIMAGGRAPPDLNETETYDGTSWTEVANLNVNRSFGASASSTPAPTAIVFGGIDGYPTTVHDKTEKWDGTSWTEVNPLNTGRTYPGGAGALNTNALCFAGNVSPSKQVESWDGTSWSAENSLLGARLEGARGAGTNTAAICFGGTPGPQANTELWNGTSWSQVNDLNLGRSYSVAWGTSTAAMCGSGNPPLTTNCELWDGTCWTETTNLAGARFDAGAGGTGTTNGIAAGGYPPFLSTTEVWNNPVYSIKTVTTS